MQLSKSAAVCGLVGGLLIVGCGDSSRSSSPTAPSALTDASMSAAVAAGAQAEAPSSGGNGNGNGNGNGGGNSNPGGNGNGNGGNGNGNGNGNGGGGNGNGNGNANPGNPQVNEPPSHHGNPHQQPSNQTPNPNVPHNPNTGVAQVEGVITEIVGSSITVRDHVIAVPAGTTIRHGSKHYDFEDLHVGDRVHVTATIVSGGLEAREVKLQEEITPAVTVLAIDADAAEVGLETGSFRITRVASASVPLDAPLTVSFAFGGTAQSGVDYITIDGTVTMAAGESSVDVIVTPLSDTATEGAETITLTLTDAAPAVIGSPSSSTITIADTPVVLPVVAVTAIDPTAAEAGVNPGIFQFSRSGSTDDPLTITFELGGTASHGVDYVAVPVTVTFLADESHAYVVIHPVADATVEGSETVILTIVDDADYEIDPPVAATVSIAG